MIEGLRKALEEKPFYDGFVAVQNATYLGSALVIRSDMDERPDYTPWVAAVFVEPEYRGRGIGAALVQRAAQSSHEKAAQNIYLCATKTNSPYYEKLGWISIEANVGIDRLTVFKKTASNNAEPV